jgi:hypothetical protein
VKIVNLIALAMALAFLCTGAQAQTRYTCRYNGGYYQSTQPCPGTSSGGSDLVYHGPVTPQPRYEPQTPRVTEAPSTLSYLSPRCASLSDAIRTAPSRGLKYDTIRQLQQEYSRECSEDESEARSRLSQERRDQKQQQKEAMALTKAEQERASIRAQQCGESKRILVTKRARTDLTDGEKADLKRFEENYLARCS